MHEEVFLSLSFVLPLYLKFPTKTYDSYGNLIVVSLVNLKQRCLQILVTFNP